MRRDQLESVSTVCIVSSGRPIGVNPRLVRLVRGFVGLDGIYRSSS